MLPWLSHLNAALPQHLVAQRVVRQLQAGHDDLEALGQLRHAVLRCVALGAGAVGRGVVRGGRVGSGQGTAERCRRCSVSSSPPRKDLSRRAWDEGGSRAHYEDAFALKIKVTKFGQHAVNGGPAGAMASAARVSGRNGEQ